MTGLRGLLGLIPAFLSGTIIPASSGPGRVLKGSVTSNGVSDVLRRTVTIGGIVFTVRHLSMVVGRFAFLAIVRNVFAV